MRNHPQENPLQQDKRLVLEFFQNQSVEQLTAWLLKLPNTAPIRMHTMERIEAQIIEVIIRQAPEEVQKKFEVAVVYALDALRNDAKFLEKLDVVNEIIWLICFLRIQGALFVLEQTIDTWAGVLHTSPQGKNFLENLINIFTGFDVQQPEAVLSAINLWSKSAVFDEYTSQFFIAQCTADPNNFVAHIHYFLAMNRKLNNIWGDIMPLMAGYSARVIEITKLEEALRQLPAGEIQNFVQVALKKAYERKQR
jgi:hypothetical protein